ncbi:dNA mismatch endonuclease Vsr [Phascolarctobacterium sp. CAG:266]|nr:dNA mismatch endonuclease Vsr [Phascolarctobacterium sp. CAG:266]
MTDRITKEQRSKNMSQIRSKDTSIELKVRKYLFSLGYRYRVNYKELPGKPDIVFTKKKIAIFIHGCYWHGHNCNSRYAHISKSNTNYWNTKIQRNQERDKRNIEQLEKDGWKVIVLWECEIKDNFEEKSKYILSFL